MHSTGIAVRQPFALCYFMADKSETSIRVKAQRGYGKTLMALTSLV